MLGSASIDLLKQSRESLAGRIRYLELAPLYSPKVYVRDSGLVPALLGLGEREWGAVFEAAARAEASVYGDPRTACFYARRALELAVSWAYKHDPALRLP